jgi:hypothetical protein
MSHNSNLAILKNNSVIPISIVTTKESFNKFYAIYISASWDNKVLAVANLLSLPVSSCLLDKNLMLIEDTEGKKLGHNDIYSFVTKSKDDFGLGRDWEGWESDVLALIQKLEFGINSNSSEDVLLQVQDVTSKLGRKPVSKFEFNLAKDQIVREQLNTIQSEHKSVVSEMSSRVAKLIDQLEAERKEKFKAIEGLESALAEINVLKNNNQTVNLKNYVESSLYNKIVDEIEALKSEHGEVLQSYLGKISKLSIINNKQLSQIERLNELISLRNNEISLLSDNATSAEYQENTELNDEIKSLKVQVIGLLKSNIYKQKVINKQKIISHQKTQINKLLRNKEACLQNHVARSVKKLNNQKTSKTKISSLLSKTWVVGLIAYLAIASSVIALYTMV